MYFFLDNGSIAEQGKQDVENFVAGFKDLQGKVLVKLLTAFSVCAYVEADTGVGNSVLTAYSRM